MRIALLLFAFASTAAADCVTQQFVGCGARVSATLDAGCENRYSFSGVKDQVISATIRPVDAPLTNPRLVLSAPFGIHAPVISGGEAATLNYVLPSNDVYTISVSADSPGRYVFALGCRAANPGVPRDCVREELVSRERVQWELTADSCRFTDHSRLATAFVLYAVAGDPVTITLQSPDFKPRIAIYSFDALLQQTTVDASSIIFVSRASARYWVMATTTAEETTGRYELTMSAQRSGCIAPLVMREPDDVTVAYGSRAKLSAGISASRDGLLWEWLDVLALPTIVSNAPELVTPPVALPQFYAARITNPCGSTMSRMATVSAETNRRRTTR
jgi:hypothetical protein